MPNHQRIQKNRFVRYEAAQTQQRAGLLQKLRGKEIAAARLRRNLHPGISRFHSTVAIFS